MTGTVVFGCFCLLPLFSRLVVRGQKLVVITWYRQSNFTVHLVFHECYQRRLLKEQWHEAIVLAGTTLWFHQSDWLDPETLSSS